MTQKKVCCFIDGFNFIILLLILFPETKVFMGPTLRVTTIITGLKGRNHEKIFAKFIGLWEKLNNPDFKGVEFDHFLNEAGCNSFTLLPTKELTFWLKWKEGLFTTKLL